MCIFTKAVRGVSDTTILASPVGARHQLLVYQMNVETRDPLAMVLPIPTPLDASDDAVVFYDLHHHAGMLDLLRVLAFPPRARPSEEDDEPYVVMALSADRAPLPVVRLVDGIASFVPHARDFDRLDPAFRLRRSVLADLPEVADFGWVVVQLTPGSHRFAPIAFEFPRRDPRRLWFPTRHVHDDHVPDAAHYDHHLLALGIRRLADDNRNLAIRWEAAEKDDEDNALSFAKETPLHDRLATHWWSGRLSGSRWNQDLWVREA